MPIEPLYSLEVACELIPCTMPALLHVLSRHPGKFNPPLYHAGGEPRYRNGRLTDYEGGRARRMLTETECLTVRNMMMRIGKNGTTRACNHTAARIADLIPAEFLELDDAK
jgi:hypothetical protein